MIGRLVAALRDAPFLSAGRARVYGRLWLILQLGFAALMVGAFIRESVTVGGGKPVGTDFMTFWSAARMAVGGDPASAYDDTARAALQRAAAWMGSEPGAHFAYWYPPTFLLVTLPLGLLGYVPAMIAFLCAGYAVLGGCLKRIVPVRAVWVPLLLSPAMLLNTLIGQNGAFTASCFGGAMVLLDRRPMLGGACLGLLVCKPHLAVAAPLALAAARRWRALAGWAATAFGLCALSWLLLGTASWLLFLRHASEARTVLEHLSDDWPKIQSVYTAVRLLHGGTVLGYVLHATAALVSLAVLLSVARRRPGAAPEMATLVVVSLLCTPYMFDYDLTCLLVPMAFIAAAALRGGWLGWEKTLLLGLYGMPLVARLVAMHAGVPLVPPALACLLALCARRALARNIRGPGAAAAPMAVA